MEYIDVFDLSKYIISKCTNDKKHITNLYLQKILYYIQYEFLDITGEPIFWEDIEAWSFGCVVPCIYYHFSFFGSKTIRVEFDNWEKLIGEDNLSVDIINKVIEEKREMNPWELVKDVQKKGGAWDITYNNGEGLKQVIPIKLIKNDIRNFK